MTIAIENVNRAATEILTKSEWGLTLIEAEGYGKFLLPPLESCSDGELDAKAGDWYAYNARWEHDAVSDWQIKYKALYEWIQANVTDPTWSIDLDGEPTYCEDGPHMDELNLFVRRYRLMIKDRAQAAAFKLRWVMPSEEVHAAVIVEDGEVVEFSVFSDRAAAEARIIDYAQEQYQDDEDDDDVTLPQDYEAAQEYLSEFRSMDASIQSGNINWHA